ncbi:MULTISPECIES: serine/threonine-protein kinase [Mycolicibacterium]|jgi:serine/threonine-protein kinase|uniref:non-specific serine/threonine protein kinase n=2 Tax=Mycolicibacterium TaxID=1866885 RepID=A0A378TGI6_9MYCO|nr:MULTISPECIES: serine/threonine-protein kinase [Mycolicibacterium]ANW67039.1 serine/threonine protein kinase [Mycobacterium sp. djl-10]MCV7180620.1 serine/threonine protein kinase [Mycolicibacterium murale]STZ59922.1 serine/threonine protein kinase [Mycolicibacterium tokaiense]BBY85565.1 serine/threonine-protein kinase PknF [Mycolicibacterium tokaiense]GFG56841.1 serine/threonine-protein kinase PknF [Mycolicibacterium murale]
MPLETGQEFAGYEVLATLGVGGMGEVYLAQHPRLPRRDALKVLRANHTEDQEYRQRFIREADIVAGLSHPGIVSVHDRGEADGKLWIAMDYIDGTDAGKLLTKQYPQGMPVALVIHIVKAIADALDYAHQRQLLHRDIKPANILLADPDSEEPRVYLGDFGIARWADDSAKLTATDVAVGTVAYAAPEQLMGGDVDGRADQYALAATAFQLLTGKPLFQHSNQAVVISQHISAEPPDIAERRPELSALSPVFRRALSKQPRERFASCRQFARALEQQLGGSDETDATQLAFASDPGTTPRSSSRRKLAWLGAGAAAVLIAGLVAMVVVLEKRSGEQEQTPAAGTAVPHLPVVLIGADCEPLGAAGESTTGAQAYCAHLPAANQAVWSLYNGTLPSPTVAPGPTDEVYPPGIEQQVQLCVQQTGKSRIECRDDVREGNIVGPA